MGLALALLQCGDLGVDGQKDLFGAIGFKSGSDPIMAPGQSACGASAGGTGAGTAGATTTTVARCFSAAEAANAVTQQCAGCELVLAFKGTNEETQCGSIAMTSNKTIFGVGTSKLIAEAQGLALASCKAKELQAAITTSSCSLVASQCLK